MDFRGNGVDEMQSPDIGEAATLQVRVTDLEKKVQDQDDELLCLKSSLADVIRRLSSFEQQQHHANNNYLQQSHSPRGLQVNSSGYVYKGTGLSGSQTANQFRSRTPNRNKEDGLRRSSAGTGSGGPHHMQQSPKHSASKLRNTGSTQSGTNMKKWSSTSDFINHSGGVTSGSTSGSTSQLSPAKRHSSTSYTNLSNMSLGMHGDSARLFPHVQYHTVRRDGSASVSNLLSTTSRSSLLSGSTGYLSTPVPGPGTNSTHSSSLQQRASTAAKEPTYNSEEGMLRMLLRGRAVVMHSPTMLAADYQPNKPLPPPSQRLKLEWVYGFRGRDCRSNLYLLPTGEMVYFIAAVVVLYNVDEQMQRHYLGHTDDVKCMSVHPNKLLIATGQVTGHGRGRSQRNCMKSPNGSVLTSVTEDEQLMAHVRVWDSVSLNTIHVIGACDFERGIACLAFSKADGGHILCVIDESNEHVLSVWDWNKGERGQKLTEAKTCGDTVLGVDFHPIDRHTIIQIGKQHIFFWSLEGGLLSKKVGVFDRIDKPKYVLCLTFSDLGNTITGDSNGNLLLWQRGSNTVTHCISGAHEGGVFSLLTTKDGTLLSGGGKDRRIIKWDNALNPQRETSLPEYIGPVRTLAQGKGNMMLVGTTHNSILQGTIDLKFSIIVQGHVDELWGLDTHPMQHQFVTCGFDKNIYLWDTLSHSSVWSAELPDKARAVCFHPSGCVLAISTLTAQWHVMDASTRELLATNCDGNEMVSCLRYSPDGRFLALGSHNNNIYVYQVSDDGHGYNRINHCIGHSSFITHLDWSEDSQYLRSNSGDYEILHWNAAVCRQVTSTTSMRDVQWSTNHCCLSFNTCGIWQIGSDGTDINTCDKSNGSKLVAVGDDFGHVCLYQYPCNQPKSQCHTYGGHSSHVTTVRFLFNDTRLITVGGKDQAIFQWMVT